jgi:hypothetical protein
MSAATALVTGMTSVPTRASDSARESRKLISAASTRPINAPTGQFTRRTLR